MSIRYASPELLSGSLQTVKSDMWAWGCLFLKVSAEWSKLRDGRLMTRQITTNTLPYEDATDFSCMLRIAEGESPAHLLAIGMPGLFRSMLALCWDREPQARPSITRCLNIIESEGQLRNSGTVCEEFIVEFVHLPFRC
jgi:serine/threonine protein kinase